MVCLDVVCYCLEMFGLVVYVDDDLCVVVENVECIYVVWLVSCLLCLLGGGYY